MESSPWLLGDGANVKNNYSSKKMLILSLIFFFKLESIEDLVFIQVTAENAFQHIMEPRILSPGPQMYLERYRAHFP